MVEKSIQEQRIDKVLHQIQFINPQLSYKIKDKYKFLQQQLWSFIDIISETDTAEISVKDNKIEVKKDDLIFKQKNYGIDVENIRDFMIEIINEKKPKLIYELSDRIKNRFRKPPRQFIPKIISFKIVSKTYYPRRTPNEEEIKKQEEYDRKEIIPNHLAKIITAFSLIKYDLTPKQKDMVSESIYYQLNQYVQTGYIQIKTPKKLNVNKFPKAMVYLPGDGIDLIWRFSKYCSYCLERIDDECFCKSIEHGMPEMKDVYLEIPCHKCKKELIKRALTQNYNKIYTKSDCKNSLYDIEIFINEITPYINDCFPKDYFSDKEIKSTISTFNKKYGKWFKCKYIIDDKYRKEAICFYIVESKKITESNFEEIWKKIINLYAKEYDYEIENNFKNYTQCTEPCPNW